MSNEISYDMVMSFRRQMQLKKGFYKDKIVQIQSGGF
jgi:hypothetical protein